MLGFRTFKILKAFPLGSLGTSRIKIVLYAAASLLCSSLYPRAIASFQLNDDDFFPHYIKPGRK